MGCKVPTDLMKISVKEATHMGFYYNIPQAAVYVTSAPYLERGVQDFGCSAHFPLNQDATNLANKNFKSIFFKEKCLNFSEFWNLRVFLIARFVLKIAEFPLLVPQIWQYRKQVIIQIQFVNIYISEWKYYCLHLISKSGDVHNCQDWWLNSTVYICILC